MGYRSERKRIRSSDAIETRARNRVFKAKERVRRDARMVQMITDGAPPYSPMVMSWLSRKLDKRASRITPADIKAFLG